PGLHVPDPNPVADAGASQRFAVRGERQTHDVPIHRADSLHFPPAGGVPDFYVAFDAAGGEAFAVTGKLDRPYALVVRLPGGHFRPRRQVPEFHRTVYAAQGVERFIRLHVARFGRNAVEGGHVVRSLKIHTRPGLRRPDAHTVGPVRDEVSATAEESH